MLREIAIRIDFEGDISFIVLNDMLNIGRLHGLWPWVGIRFGCQYVPSVSNKQGPATDREGALGCDSYEVRIGILDSDPRPRKVGAGSRSFPSTQATLSAWPSSWTWRSIRFD